MLNQEEVSSEDCVLIKNPERDMTAAIILQAINSIQNIDITLALPHQQQKNIEMEAYRWAINYLQSELFLKDCESLGIDWGAAFTRLKPFALQSIRRYNSYLNELTSHD